MVALAGTSRSLKTPVRIRDPSRAYGVGSRSATPRTRVATRWVAMHVWPRFTTLLRNLRCVAETPHTAHALQSQTASHRDMDSVKEHLIKWHRTTRVTRTHPDTKVHRKGSSRHQPFQARIRHPYKALPRRERKKGKDEGTLERTGTKHGLRRLYSRKRFAVPHKV
jgi:hypothetical protein